MSLKSVIVRALDFTALFSVNPRGARFKGRNRFLDVAVIDSFVRYSYACII